MAKVKVCVPVNIVSGDEFNSFTESIVGTAGSGSIPSGYFGVNINLWVCLMDDRSVHVAYNGGTVRANQKTGAPSGRRNWKLWMAVYHSSFQIKDGPGGLSTPGKWLYADGGILPSEVQDANPGYQRYVVPTREQAVKGSTSLPSGYEAITPYVNHQERKIGFYISGLVEYDERPDSEVWMGSKFIEIEDEEIINEFFEYYPWERYAGGSSGSGGNVDVETGGSGSGDTSITQPGSGSSSSGWASLNRNGASTDSSGLHRMDGSWVRETNKQGQDSSEDHVHRYNSGWVKSQKV